jgi:transposase InsO family protein
VEGSLVFHSKAKLTSFGRRLLIARIESGWSLRRAAVALGISPARASVLYRRFALEGEASFAIRSSRPRHAPRRTSARTEARIARERRRRRWGPLRLQWLLGIARSTIYAVLRRLGLQHLRVFRLPLPKSRRYERPVPGDLLHIDTKKLGRVGPGGGHRFLGRGEPQRHRGIGSEFIHVAVDDRSRVAYVERLPRDDAEHSAAFLERALHYFADLGVSVRQVLTDNYLSYTRGRRFAEVLAAHGIEHITPPPYTPTWNAKAEAFIWILLREWAYARPYRDNRARAIALPAFIHRYTHRRPHGELGGLTPMERLLRDVHNVRGQLS